MTCFEMLTNPDTLRAGWRSVLDNAGGSGGDGQSPGAFGADIDRQISQLRRELMEGSYRPRSLRRRRIAKPGGGVRLLAVPAVRDRVVQAAVCAVLSPMFERRMSPDSFAYRRRLSVEDAMCRIVLHRLRGRAHVAETDIAAFFDEIPHDLLIAELRAAGTPARVRRLIGCWLEGFSSDGCGLAQGAPISPLLANLFLTPVDLAIATRRLKLVRYADDIVLLSHERRVAEQGLSRLEGLLVRRGLRLKPEKTRLTSFDEGFDFLGARFQGDRVIRGGGLS